MHLQLKAPERLQLSGDVESNWRRFKQQFLLYYRAVQGTVGRGEVTKLLKIAGPQAVNVFNTFMFDRPEDRWSLDVVLAKFDSHCSLQENQAYWRYVFLSRTQQPDESFDSFLADLRLKVQTCDYGAQRDSMVRDQVVFGVLDQAAREALLGAEELTLEAAVRICRGQQQEVNTTSRKMVATGGAANSAAAEIPLTKGKRKRLRQREKEAEKRAAAKLAAATNGSRDSADGGDCTRCGSLHTPSLGECPASNEHEQQCTKCDDDHHHPAQRCCSVSPGSSGGNAKRRRTQEAVEVGEDAAEDPDDQREDRTMVAQGAWNQNYLDDEHRETWYIDTMPDNLCLNTFHSPEQC